jgi:hypothetical protein
LSITPRHSRPFVEGDVALTFIPRHARAGWNTLSYGENVGTRFLPLRHCRSELVLYIADPSLNPPINRGFSDERRHRPPRRMYSKASLTQLFL